MPIHSDSFSRLKAFILIIGVVLSLLTGCEDNMDSKFKIAESPEKASTPIEEAKALEEVLGVIKNENTPITIAVSENNIEIPVQEVAEKLNSDLIVNILFDDGSSFKWKPLDNQNIFLLMRE